MQVPTLRTPLPWKIGLLVALSIALAGLVAAFAGYFVHVAIAEREINGVLLAAAPEWQRVLIIAIAGSGVATLLGAIIAIISAIRASTRTQLAATHAASTSQLRLFVDREPAAIAMFDTNMRYLAASPRYLKDYRLDCVAEPSAVVGHSHYDLFPEIPERWRDIHRRALAGETLSADDDPFPRADGGLDWVRWEMAPWLRVDGAIGGVMLLSEVVTARKQAGRGQAFLLDFADRLRATPHETIAAAAGLLGHHFGVSRACYSKVDDAEEFVTAQHEFTDATIPPPSARDVWLRLDWRSSSNCAPAARWWLTMSCRTLVRAP
jgi:PAS domain-containing protein